jgi:hypothetical protein
MSSTNGKRSCVFCGHEGKLTVEHVWPAWVDQYIPTIPGGKAGYKHKHGTSDGRFEALFEYERLDHLGEGCLYRLQQLNVDAQRIVATWAVKTAVCVERTFPIATQITQACPPPSRPP